MNVIDVVAASFLLLKSWKKSLENLQTSLGLNSQQIYSYKDSGKT